VPFLETDFFTVFLTSFLGSSLARMLLILSALLPWITFFLAALSAKETAFFIFSTDFDLFAILIAASKPDKIREFVPSFLFELLRALLAVFVTGIKYPINYRSSCEYNLN
jgi:hypothetical protein